MIDFLLEKYNELGATGLNGTIAVILAIVVVIGFIKGAVRLIFMLLTVAGVAFSAYWGCEFGLDFLSKYWSNIPLISGNVMGAVCGVASYFLLSKIFGFLADPTEKLGLVGKFAFGVPAAILSAVVAVAILWFGGNLLREKGTKDEMRYWISQSTDTPMEKPPVLVGLKYKFEDSVVGKALSSLYQLQGEDHQSLAKLFVLAKSTGPELMKLRENPLVQKIFRNENFQKVLANNSEVQEGIAENNPDKILESAELQELLKDPKMRDELLKVASELATRAE